MDIVLGIRLTDSTIIATSKAITRGISVLKDNDDKTRVLNAHNLVAFTGESGDTVQFAEYMQANIQLYSMRENDIELSPKATASFVRSQLATSIRSRKPYQVNVLLGGFDTKSNEPTLNYIDYLGTQAVLPYAAHGYAAFYCMSLLDKHYRTNMTLDDGLKLLDMCIRELETRMPMDFKGCYVKVVDKDGVREIS
ncbi:Proteasome subunit beta type-4 [Yamadazyma tenuis]|uniref:Proteasome subunit beta n=1 Tax=Candida tenuis (strain ATCC 10573 / BCRC 21748 / CBS 615 / JCM 9827 / NBRC 10315 / NRRL Y-1498 / VKM Y-70) TaxID=590646 RepID=G3BAA9_CANTC|nr:N-terminal nucleophile aminohydrolase [Yamadazyma tenuis ATCC 10573]EGV61397.1 N-terminal nucleophile aminohydrolase [Yamadazyma tenuis ATCC 10573]WEJ92616.1 Proteasome subunit beta type-4 [Yamadazyma tenuis]